MAQVRATSRDLLNREVHDDRFIYAKLLSGLSHLLAPFGQVTFG